MAGLFGAQSRDAPRSGLGISNQRFEVNAEDVHISSGPRDTKIKIHVGFSIWPDDENGGRVAEAICVAARRIACPGVGAALTGIGGC